MKEFNRLGTELSPLKQAFVAIESLQDKLQVMEDSAKEPIAIVGMSCRLPGQVESPQQLWEFLRRAGDGIRRDNGLDSKTKPRWPTDRFVDSDRNAAGKTVTLSAGLINDYDKFDAKFFGIAPREAETMDPQQRLALELSWSAVQDAGYPAASLEGSDTGVFLGVGAAEYFRFCLQSDNEDAGFYVTGNTQNVISGRIAYTVGLQGPALAIDTACSSSLVAIHTAVQALRRGECSAALAGGVNLLVDPQVFVSLSKANMLAPDGRCKTFDDSADGYVRGEGGGVLLLKTLSQAKRDNDHIHAVICGTAVNQDGRSSSLTAPNGPAQQKVIKKALADARLEPDAVTYIETHGTGTPLGDPIEVHALNAVYGQCDRQQPLVLGALKSNIGHLEAASGVASIIKAVLALQHCEIPPNLHFHQQNSHLEIAGSPIVFPTETLSWSPASGQPLAAGVSSFGFSGTNCHIILGQAPDMDGQSRDQKSQQQENQRDSRTDSCDSAESAVEPQWLLPLSAKSSAALEAIIGRFADSLHGTPAGEVHSLADICYTAATGRDHYPHRKTFVASSAAAMAAQLDKFAAGESSGGEGTPVALSQRKTPRIGFMFTGQGAQYSGMARELYQQEPVFRQALDACAADLEGVLEKPLLEVMWHENAALLNQTAYTQPALFAVEYALAKLWQSWGVTPTVVMGHSVGEIAAACVAGLFSLRDGIRLIAERGRLMQSLPSGGGMLVVMEDRDFVKSLLDNLTGADALQTGIAAYNTPEQTVVAGPLSVLETIKTLCETKEVGYVELPVSHAFHSPLMQPIVGAFTEFASRITYQKPALTLFSNVSAKAEEQALRSATYWAEHILAPVNFTETVQAFSESVDIVIEIGPRPTLTGMAKVSCQAAVQWISSMVQGRSDTETILTGLGQLYECGVDIDWSLVFSDDGNTRGRRISVPVYPYQRQRFWLDQGVGGEFPISTGAALTGSHLTDSHPLLGLRLPLPTLAESCYQTQLSAGSPGYLEHHRLFGTVIVPGASHVAMAVAAVGDRFGCAACELEAIAFFQTIAIPDGEERLAQIALSPESEKSEHKSRVRQGQFNIISLNDRTQLHDSHAWNTNATGKFRTLIDNAETISSIDVQTIDVQDALNTWTLEESGTDFYARIWNNGYTLGSAFRWVGDRLKKGDLTLHCIEVPVLPDDQQIYPLYPGLVDSCFQAFGSSVPLAAGEDDIYIPFSVERLRFYQQPTAANGLWCLSKPRDDYGGTEANKARYVGDLTLFDNNGRVFMEVVGLELRKSSRKLLQDSLRGDGERKSLYTTEWERLQPSEGAQTADGGTWLLLTNPGDVGVHAQCRDFLADFFAARTMEWVSVYRGDAFAELSPNVFSLRTGECGDFEALFRHLRAGGAGSNPIAGIINLWPLEASASCAEAAQQQMLSLCGEMTALVKACLTELADSPPVLQVVTAMGQTVEQARGQAPLNPIQHALWSLGRVIRLEQPQLQCRFFDLDTAPGAEDVSLLTSELCNERGTGGVENEILLRHGERYTHRLARLQRIDQTTTDKKDLPVYADATYLLTGAYGGVGFETLHWLIDRGAKNLALLVRRQPSEAQQAALDKYRARGIDIRCYHCDLNDFEQVSTQVEKIRAEQPRLAGVLHLAGVLDDRFVEQQNRDSYARAFAPKIAATWNLDLATRCPEINFFVCFSSIAAAFGTPGQANYAVANGFMDGLMAARRQAGFEGLSVNWGPWADVGMAASADKHGVNDKMQAVGMNPFEVGQGLQALETLITSASYLAAEAPPVIYADLDWPDFLRNFPGADINPLFRHFQEEYLGEELARGSYLKVLSEAPVNERNHLLIEQVKSIVIDIMKLGGTEDVGEDMGFFDSGMDSLMSLEFRQKLERVYDITLPTTVAFNYPTIGELIQYLREDVLAIDFSVQTISAAESGDAGTSEIGDLKDDYSEEDIARMLEEQLAVMAED